MIIHHQNNVAAFTGAHTFYWPMQPLLFQRISIDAGAVPEPTGEKFEGFIANVGRMMRG